MATAKKTAKSKAVKATSVKSVAAPSEPKPEGRPTKYKPEYADLARKFCLLGANNKRLAELFEVAESTINKWLVDTPEFSEAVRAGREIADANVANSLYQRAIGYEHVEDDIRTVAIGMGQGSEIVITPTIKRYAPDTGAATMWLKNRQPQLWRDKVEVEHGGAVGFDKAPVEELTGALNDLLAKLQ